MADHVAGGCGHWPEVTATDRVRALIEARGGPRDVGATPPPAGARDVIVTAEHQVQLLGPLWRHHVWTCWRSISPLALSVLVVARWQGSLSVVAVAILLVLLSPYGGRRRLRRRIAALYPDGSAVRLQLSGNRLVVDTATYRFAIEGA